MTKQNVAVRGSEIRAGDRLLGHEVTNAFASQSYVPAAHETETPPLALIDFGAGAIYVRSHDLFTVEREVTPTRYKEGTVAVSTRSGRTIVRRSGDWMLTSNKTTYWYSTEGDDSVAKSGSGWEIVYGGPEEQA